MCLNQRPNVGINGPGEAHDPALTDPGNPQRATARALGHGGGPPPLLESPNIQGDPEKNGEIRKR